MTELGIPAHEARRTAAPAQARLWRACQDLEACFGVYLVRAMRAGLRSPEIAGAAFYAGLEESALARVLSERGALGLAEALYARLSKSAAANGEPERNKAPGP